MPARCPAAPHPATTARLAEVLKADTEKKIKAVCVVHNETTTGVTSDIPEVRAALGALGVLGMLGRAVGDEHCQQAGAGAESLPQGTR